MTMNTGSWTPEANFSVCLAKHGMHLPTGDGKLPACVQSASSKTEG
jgi:hypothetical protein